MNQPPMPPMQPMQPMRPMDSGSSMKMWWVIGIIAVAVVAAGWYLYGSKVPTASAPTAIVEETQPAGDTTADIANDLNAVPDVTADLAADQAASSQAVSGL